VLVQRTIKQGEFMSRRYYERDEDWLVTFPECHGKGTIGTGDSRVRCSKCDGAGKIRR
jgi:DnaJ-class molecular chaperone